MAQIALYRALALLAASLTLVTSSPVVSIGSTPQQTIASFGASGAWWPNDLILFPSAVQSQLGDLLFSEDGLYLSSYRYNMGGDGGNDTKVVTTWESRIESFLLTNGTYEFSRDHAGVTFLKMAQTYNVSYITFFINAAPSHIAGAACDSNLTTTMIPPFADYITTVLSYWTSNGIDISYISPVNEPDNNRSDCGQEGMSVDPTIRPDLFSTLKDALSTNQSTVGIIGDETSQVTTQAFPEYPVWFPSSAPDLSHIAVHNYDYPNDSSLVTYNALIHNLTSPAPPPSVKFTETCCSTNSGTGSSVFGAQYDPTMANALIVARYVWQFLTLVNAVSFDWWTAVTYLPCSPTLNSTAATTCDPTVINETSGYNSGLFYIDPYYNQSGDYTLYMTKRAFAVKQFSYFHRPGSIRYEVKTTTPLPLGVEAFATLAPTKDAYHVLFLNNQTTPQPIVMQLPLANTTSNSSDYFHLKSITETSPSQDWYNVSSLPAVQPNGTTVFDVPATSLWTLTLVSS